MINNPPLFDKLPGPDRDRMISLQRALRRSQGSVRINFTFVGISNGVLDKALSRAGRLAFFTWAFGREIGSSKELTITESFNLVAWLGPRKTGNERSDPWTYSREFIHDLPILIRLFSGGVGQMSIPMPDDAAPDTDLPVSLAGELRRAQKRNLRELGFYEEK